MKSLFSFEKILNIKPNRSDIDFEANQVRFQNSLNVLQELGFLYNLLGIEQSYFERSLTLMVLIVLHIRVAKY